MAIRVLLFEDIDIFALGHVKNIINIVEKKTLKRDKLINNAYSLEVKNFDNFYSINNSASVFNSERYYHGPLKIFDSEDNTLWDGMIRKITRNPDKSTANIFTINRLHKKWRTKIEYESSGFETAATAAKNIMDTYNVDYNNRILQESITDLTDAGSLLKVNFNLSDDITLMQGLEKLAEFSCSDLYSSKNEVNFKHWTPFSGSVDVTINESDIINFRRIDVLEEELINQYRIGYEGDLGIPAIDDTNNNLGQISRQDSFYGEHSLPEMDSSNSDSQIWFKNKTSAVYVGECYMKRSHINLQTNPRPIETITFSIKGTFQSWIDLNTFFKFNWSNESWINKVFEFFTVGLDFNKNLTNLVAYEVQT